MTFQILCIIIAVISSLFSEVIVVSQLIHITRTKNTSGVSLITQIAFLISQFITLSWAFGFYFLNLNRGLDPELNLNPILLQWSIVPTIMINLSFFIFVSMLIGIKVKHLYLCKKYQITEIALSEKLLHKTSKIKQYNQLVLTIIFIAFIILISIMSGVALVITTKVKPYSPQVNWPWVTVFMWISSISWEIISWPQFIKSIKYKDTTGLSLGWVLFMLISCLLVFTYDLSLSFVSGKFSTENLGSLIFNGIAASLGPLIMKLKNMSAANKLGLSELEYTKKYLLPKIKRDK